MSCFCSFEGVQNSVLTQGKHRLYDRPVNAPKESLQLGMLLLRIKIWGEEGET